MDPAIRAHRGYTYVGVMVLIAIIAVTSAAVLATGSSMQRRMNEEELLFIGGQFAAAFRSYFEATPAGQRNYPAKLDELLRDSRYPGVRRHLRRIYLDPMTGKADWGLVAAPGGVIGVHSLSRQAPIKIQGFEPAFASLAGKKTYVEWAFGFLPPGVVPAGNVTLTGTLVPSAVPGSPNPLAPKPGTSGTAPPAVTLPSSPSPFGPVTTEPDQTAEPPPRERSFEK